MAICDVLQLGDPRLREVCSPVEYPASEEVRFTLIDLQDTLAYWRTATTYGRGIAAPQYLKITEHIRACASHSSPLPPQGFARRFIIVFDIKDSEIGVFAMRSTSRAGICDGIHGMNAAAS